MQGVQKEIAELLDFPALKTCSDDQDFEKVLTEMVTYLIEHDFARLCQTLYRVDVDEQVLKAALEGAGETPPGKIIAQLLLQRQEQKLILRQRFQQPKDNIKEEDRW